MWAPGDIAECLPGADWRRMYGPAYRGIAPLPGSRYIVTTVRGGGRGLMFLGLVGLPNYWGARFFRKIVDMGYEEPQRVTYLLPADF